jgi:hypothetical protein
MGGTDVYLAATAALAFQSFARTFCRIGDMTCPWRIAIVMFSDELICLDRRNRL